MSYEPHNALVKAAEARSELWRVAVGLVGVFVIYGLMVAAYLEGLRSLAGTNGERLMETVLNGETPLDMVILLASFTAMTAALWIVVRWLHDRTLRSLIGSVPLAIQQGLVALGALVGLYVVISIAPPYGFSGIETTRNLGWGTWLFWLPIAVLMIFVQVSAEELVFRGYLQSQLAARVKSPFVWIGVPALLFGALHYDAANAGENAALIASWAVIFGLLAADLTARTGTLGPAIAFHFANNVMALLFVGIRGELDGLALWSYQISLSDPQLAPLIWVDFAMMITSWLTIRVALKV